MNTQQYPPDTEWVAHLCEDRGRYFHNRAVHVKGESRAKAVENALKLQASDVKVAGVSLIPANEYYALNAPTRKP